MDYMGPGMSRLRSALANLVFPLPLGNDLTRRATVRPPIPLEPPKPRPSFSSDAKRPVIAGFLHPPDLESEPVVCHTIRRSRTACMIPHPRGR